MAAEKIALVCDSTCDLTPSLRAEHGVFMVPLSVYFGDEEFEDNVDLTPEAFYRRLAAADELPTTSQPSAGKFLAVFQRLEREGYTHVLGLMINRGFSSTLQSAQVAAKMAPKLTYELIDSRTTSWGLGMMAMYAADLIRRQTPFAELAARIRDRLDKSLILFSVDTLDALQKGGRIGRAAALFGKLLNIRPVLKLSGEAPEIQVVKKVQSQAAAIAVMQEAFAAHVARCGLAYGAVLLKTAVAPPAELEAALRAAVPEIPFLGLGPIGSVIGTHLGPDGWGVAIF